MLSGSYVGLEIAGFAREMKTRTVSKQDQAWFEEHISGTQPKE